MPHATPLPPHWRDALTAAYGPALIAAPPRPAAGFAALAALGAARLIVFPDVTTDRLEDFFRLRLAQILLGRAAHDAVSVIALTGPARASGLFAARLRTAWPFRRTIFVAPAGQGEAFTAALGLAVATPEDPLPVPLESTAQPYQRIAAQFQPLWPLCGSTTAFENQIADLLHAGYFTLRIFHEPQRRPGPTLDAVAGAVLAENERHAGAHLNLLAVAAAETHDTAALDWPAYLAAAAATPIADAEARAALLRADAVLVNHLEPVGLALRAAPAARLLLDVHDDRARAEAAMLRAAGAAPAEIAAASARVDAIQQAVWATADFCTHVSVEEGDLVAAHARGFALMLPRPHVAPVAPAAAPRWDALMVGDAHIFNLAGIDWFLAALRPRPAIAALRIAVAGRAGLMRRAALENAGIAVLGFVEDLDALRAESRVMLATEQAGSGIAVKLLHAFAAGHPVVATTAALRGLPVAAREELPGAADADALETDLLAVLASPAALDERRQAVRRVGTLLRAGPSYADHLARLPAPDAARIAARRAAFAAVIAAAPQTVPAPIPAAELAAGISLAAEALPAGLALRFWHSGEEWGRWSDGAEASLTIPLERAGTARLLCLDLRVGARGGFALEVTVNGTPLAGRRIEEDGWQEWALPDATHSLPSLHVMLRVDPPFRAALYVPGDDRILGVGLARLAVR